VIVIEDAAEALPPGRTLLENSRPIAEVTFEPGLSEPPSANWPNSMN